MAKLKPFKDLVKMNKFYYYKISINSLNKLILFNVFILITACQTKTRDTISLKNTFQNKFYIGAAINTAQYLEEDQRALPILNKHFNSITPENDLKWMYIHPYPDSFYFDLSDKFVEFGLVNNMFIVGHTLIWHNQTPDWVFFHKDGEILTREELLARMKTHIYTVVGRYKGQINGWDVVNEALNEDGSMRESFWYQIIGEDYVAKAFQFAYEADPQAELYYNDYNLHNVNKADGAVQLVKSIQKQGIPVTGIGMQGHWGLEYPTKKELEDSIIKFKELGIVAITELDVDVLPSGSGYQGADISLQEVLIEKLNPYRENLPDSIQHLQSKQYEMFFEVFLKYSENISRITTWGVTDDDSWKNEWPISNRTNYPLLFDREGNPKPIVKRIIQLTE